MCPKIFVDVGSAGDQMQESKQSKKLKMFVNKAVVLMQQIRTSKFWIVNKSRIDQGLIKLLSIAKSCVIKP